MIMIQTVIIFWYAWVLPGGSRLFGQRTIICWMEQVFLYGKQNTAKCEVEASEQNDGEYGGNLFYACLLDTTVQMGLR